MNASLVVVEGLSKSYGSFSAVSNLSLSVECGERVALLGPNGAGKTTTLRMLMGILQPSAGRASIAGLDCFQDRAEAKRHVGYLPDEPAFQDYLRGSEILRFVAEMHGLERSDWSERSNSLVDRLELDDALDEFAVNYSKGMKKKLALICALLHRPRLLILDEPTNGLDPYATRTLHTMVHELADAGTAILFSTHLLDQAERLCDRVGILARGELGAFGPIDELKARLPTGGSLEDLFFQVTAQQSFRTESEASPRGVDLESPVPRDASGPGAPRGASTPDDDSGPDVRP